MTEGLKVIRRGPPSRFRRKLSRSHKSELSAFVVPAKHVHLRSESVVQGNTLVLVALASFAHKVKEAMLHKYWYLPDPVCWFALLDFLAL